MRTTMSAANILYWIIQTIVTLSVILAISLSFKSSLDSENIYQNLRNDQTAKSLQTGVSNKSCRYPLIKVNGFCQPPCNWSFMTSSEMEIYDKIMSNCLRIAMISAVITFLTWLACEPLRKFPHIVRFYILLSSASFTFAGIFPSKLSTIKQHMHCSKEEYWTAVGITSNMVTLQGAVCHYLLLMLCFWLFCYVANTFLLIVLEKRHIFTNPKLHVIQLMFCTIAPSIFVAICLLVEQPGYHMIFKDRMAILPSTYILVFGTITLPILLMSGASLTMLIAVVRCIRKVSRNSTTAGQVIRSDEERRSLKNIERHFICIICLYALAMIAIFVAEVFLQDQEIDYLKNILAYFSCLRTNEPCNKSDRPKFFLSNMKILTPGFFCLVTFFLLFCTNETRSIWRGWLQWICSKLSIVGQYLLGWIRECNMFLTRKHSLRMADQVRPAGADVNRVSFGSVISTNGLLSYDTRGTTLGDEHLARNNDVIITHL
ncbi:uncharacterized protein LOC114527094 isoform X2 [Dendronephthya gigantea]|uniref:uncharacterized protein LOC114527094 isoform X2 n=1 Tax=Dendronephthya gigantea TaxID=151771 RepID=UPI00106990E3|nr:uncharacterized protein LOC114527094 isoform X2 [Dendronephthya gigantea]